MICNLFQLVLSLLLKITIYNTLMNTIVYKIILLLPFTFLSFLSAFSQTNPIDSLKTVLASHTHTDTVKVNLLNKIAYALFQRDPTQARLYAEQSQKMADQLNYPKGKAAGLWNMGMSYYRSDKNLVLNYSKKALLMAEQAKDQDGVAQYLLTIGIASRDLGDIKTSEQANNRALQIASTLEDQSLYIKLLYNLSLTLSGNGNYPKAIEKLHQVIDLSSKTSNWQMLSKGYSNLGVLFSRQGNGPRALEYYLSALKISEQHNNQQGIFDCLINMAGVKSDLNEGQAALETMDRAFKIAKQLNDSSMLSICLTNTGNIYKQMKNPKALDYFLEALGMARGKVVTQDINLLMNIGSIYTEQGKFAEAKQNLDEALEMAQKIGKKSAIGEVSRMLSTLYYSQKQYAQAINYTNNAMLVSNEINYLELKKDCYQLLSNIYASTGNYKEAYHNHISFKQLNDSIYNDKNVRQITLLESAYKYDKEKQSYEAEKIHQQLKIKNQRTSIFFLIAVILLVLTFSYHIHYFNRLKKKVLRLKIDEANRNLEYSQREMASATLRLMQSSESDSHSIKTLKDIEDKANQEVKEDVRSLICYYKNKHIYSNWEEFEVLFLRVNPCFYNNLNERFPTLTINERKLCVFLKLNMSNKDIANITFQSEEALKKARMRLRKKLELERDENLTSFIQSI